MGAEQGDEPGSCEEDSKTKVERLPQLWRPGYQAHRDNESRESSDNTYHDFWKGLQGGLELVSR